MDIAVAIVVAALVLYMAIGEHTRQGRQQAEKDREVAKQQVAAQRALVDEMQQLRKRLDSPVKASIVGRVVTGRP